MDKNLILQYIAVIVIIVSLVAWQVVKALRRRNSDESGGCLNCCSCGKGNRKRTRKTDDL